MSEAVTKTPLTEEQNQRRRVGRGIALAFFSAQFKADHPGAGKDDFKAAWKVARKAQTKIAMRALKQVERAGITLVPAEAAVAAE